MTITSLAKKIGTKNISRTDINSDRTRKTSRIRSSPLVKLQSKIIRNHKKSLRSSRNSSTSRKVRKKIKERKASISRLKIRLSPNTSQRRKMVRTEMAKSKVEGTIAVRSTTIRVVIKARRSRSSSRRSNRSNRITRIKR